MPFSERAGFTMIARAIILAGVSLASLRAGFVGNNYAVRVTDSGTTECGTANSYGSYGSLFDASCDFTGQDGLQFSDSMKSITPDYGVAEAYTSLSATGTSSSGSDDVYAYATAFAFDTWTNTLNEDLKIGFVVSVDVPPGGGLSGGTSTTLPVPPGQVVSDVYALCEGASNSDTPWGAPTCTGSFTIAANSSASFYMGITTGVEANFVGVPGAPFSAVADYLGSADLTAVTVTDSNGNPLSASVVESSNGTFLTANGYASDTVPEPGTLFLLGPALLFLLFPRMRSQGRTHAGSSANLRQHASRSSI